MKKNPDIKVEAVLQESDNLYTAFRTAEAAGEGPIFNIWGGTQAMEHVWKGNVARLVTIFLKKNSRLFRSRHWLRRIGTETMGNPGIWIYIWIAYDKEAMRTAE